MDPKLQKYESLFRQLTPIFLLGVGLVALFGRWIPGADWVAATFGPNFVLGFCVFLLAGYVILLWGESLRLHAMMSAVLKELLEFKHRRAGDAQGGGDAAKSAQRLEAARLLVPALSSADAKVASMARRNLSLLTGKDLGADAAAWQAWIDAEAKRTNA